MLNSKFIVTILSGLFVGVGIIVRNGAAAGGDDALAMVISKITSLNIGNVYMIGDVAVLMLSLTYLSVYDIFWSLIAVNISGRTIDFIYNFNKSRLCKIKIGERLYINVQYKRSKKRGYKNTK